MKRTTDKKLDNELLKIAKKYMCEIQSRGDLEDRHNDSEDFVEVSVWSIKAVLKAAYEKGLNDGQSNTRESKIKDYAYEWDTLDKVLKNLHTKKRFACYGETTLAQISDEPEDYRIAEELWQRLKREFNAEAATYEPEKYDSELGSIGKKKDREVMRSAWWDRIKGDEIGDYDKHTTIIEILHDGERLETGRIRFGS